MVLFVHFAELRVILIAHRLRRTQQRACSAGDKLARLVHSHRDKIFLKAAPYLFLEQRRKICRRQV